MKNRCRAMCMHKFAMKRLVVENGEKRSHTQCTIYVCAHTPVFNSCASFVCHSHNATADTAWSGHVEVTRWKCVHVSADKQLKRINEEEEKKSCIISLHGSVHASKIADAWNEVKV